MRFLFAILSCCWSLLYLPYAQAAIDKSILTADFTRLASDYMAGRKPGTVGHERAQQFITQKFKGLGLIPFDGEYHQPFYYRKSFKDSLGVNLVGYLPGKVYPNKYIVITAHYDHLGSIGTKIFNGADDNASGVAAMLAMARAFKKRRHQYSIIFFATDAEEDGLKGAKHFVDSPPVPLEDIVLNINMDMISNGGKKRQLFLAGRKTLPEAKGYFSDLRKKMSGENLKLKFGHDKFRSPLGRNGDRIDWQNASDHGPFNKKKIPYLYFGVDVHSHYHRSTDTIENVDMAFYYAAVQAVYLTLQHVDGLDLVGPKTQ